MLCANVLITARLLGCGLEHLCGPHSRRRQTGKRQRLRNGRRGGVLGPQGCSKRSPQFFHRCCRHHRDGGVTHERSQRTAWDWSKACVYGRERTKNGGEKVRRGQSDCVVSHKSGRWLMELKVRSGNSWSCWRVWGRGAFRGTLVQACGWLPHQLQQYHSPAPCLYACGAYLRAYLTTARSLRWTDTGWQQPKCLAL